MFNSKGPGGHLTPGAARAPGNVQLCVSCPGNDGEKKRFSIPKAVGQARPIAARA